MALHPDRTNRVTCTVCGWTRILDPQREYRGGHTHGENGITECHEMLDYTEVDLRSPHESWFEVEDLATFTPTWDAENAPVPVEGWVDPTPEPEPDPAP